MWNIVQFTTDTTADGWMDYFSMCYCIAAMECGWR